MPKYSVNVCRTAYGNRDIVVDAKNAKEAEERAVEVAGNFEFSEHTSNYTAEGVRKVG